MRSTFERGISRLCRGVLWETVWPAEQQGFQGKEGSFSAGDWPCLAFLWDKRGAFPLQQTERQKETDCL